MINHFYITTLNRIDNQRTWENLPLSWRGRASLVVQSHEADSYPDKYNLVVLPDNICSLSPTKEWIVKENVENRFAILDDDLSFTRTRGEDEEGPSNLPMTDKDFDELEQTICEWMDEGVSHCGLDAVWNPPTRSSLYKQNSRICMNVFYDGPKIPVNNVNWSRLVCSQDFYCCLQLLRLGYQNRVSLKYRVGQISTQAPGGCAEYRTIDLHNECMRELSLLHRGFVELREKTETGSGEWKGKTKLAATISWKKAYASSQINTLEGFMSE